MDVESSRASPDRNSNMFIHNTKNDGYMSEGSNNVFEDDPRVDDIEIPYNPRLNPGWQSDASDEGYSEFVLSKGAPEGQHGYRRVASHGSGVGSSRGTPSPLLVDPVPNGLYSPSYGGAVISYGATDNDVIGHKPDDSAEHAAVSRWPCCCCLPEWLRAELYEVIQLSWSLILLSIFNYLIAPIALAFVGHLGTKNLDGVSLACTVFNVTGISIGIGLCSTCGTFFTQAYGSTNKKQVGVYLIRGIIIIGLFIFPCYALQLNTELFLVYMGQEREVASIAGEYMSYFMPALPGVFLSEILMQYLRCQNVILPTVVIGGTAIAMDAIMHYILLYVFDFGIIGSAITQVTTFYSMALMLVVYILASGMYKETWGGLTTEVFHDWGHFFWLALAGMLMLAMEWWSFEIGTVIAGLLGPIPLAAQAIAFQVIGFAYMLPLGVGIACTIRVGQLLGGEKSLMAARSAKIGLFVIVISGLSMSAILAALSGVIPRIFTSDEEVIAYSKNVILMIAIFEFFDSVGGVCAGIIRGCGRQAIGAVVVFVGYFIIGLPIGFSLMFLTDLEVIGLYIGLTAGLLVYSGVFAIIVYRTDWELEMRRAMDNAGTANMHPEEKVALLGGGEHTEIDETTDGEYLSADETTLMVKRRRHRSKRKSLLHGHYFSRSASVANVNDQRIFIASKPSTQELILKRVTLILIMIMLFAIGLFVRLTIEIPPIGFTTLCIPRNSSFNFNSTDNATLVLCPEFVNVTTF